MCPKNVLAPSFMILPHVTLLPPPPSFSGRKKSKTKQNKTRKNHTDISYRGLKEDQLKKKEDGQSRASRTSGPPLPD